jgi:hypothetical protein
MAETDSVAEATQGSIGFNRVCVHRYVRSHEREALPLTASSKLRKIKVINHILQRYARAWVADPCSQTLARRKELRDSAVRMKAEIDKHIHKTVLAPECLAFCAVIQEKLPRELRDMSQRADLGANSSCV